MKLERKEGRRRMEVWEERRRERREERKSRAQCNRENHGRTF